MCPERSGQDCRLSGVNYWNKTKNVLTPCSVENPFQPGYLFRTTYFSICYLFAVQPAEIYRVQPPSCKINQASSRKRGYQAFLRPLRMLGFFRRLWAPPYLCDSEVSLRMSLRFCLPLPGDRRDFIRSLHFDNNSHVRWRVEGEFFECF